MAGELGDGGAILNEMVSLPTSPPHISPSFWFHLLLPLFVALSQILQNPMLFLFSWKWGRNIFHISHVHFDLTTRFHQHRRGESMDMIIHSHVQPILIISVHILSRIQLLLKSTLYNLFAAIFPTTLQYFTRNDLILKQ